MANVKISQLPAAAATLGTQEFEVNESGTSKKVTGAQIATYVISTDAGLQSIANLTTAADRMIYTTAADTYAVTTLTAAGRAILDDADNSAQRTTLGLGTIATQAANNVSVTGGAINGTTIGGTTAAAATVTQLNSGPLAGFRNAIINGNFDVWQRGTSFSNPANGAYLADRWAHGFDGTGSTRTISRGNTGVGQSVFPSKPIYYLSYNQSVAGSGATITQLYQQIENVETFSGQTISIRIGMRGNTALTLPSILVVQNFGTGGSPSASVLTTVASNVAITSSFVSYTFSVAVPSISGKTLGTDGNNCLGLFIRLPINTTFTFDITEVQVELGPVATPFERRPIGTELMLCQRYYETGATGVYATRSSNFLAVGGMFMVQKRAAPTMVNTGTYISAISSGSSIGSITSTHFIISITGADAAGATWTASAEL